MSNTHFPVYSPCVQLPSHLNEYLMQILKQLSMRVFTDDAELGKGGRESSETKLRDRERNV